MHPFDITILGCSSATPTSKRNPTAQLVNHAERFFLIDCAEATQIQLRKFKIKFQRINHIFISHLHGDHYLGLPGLLASMHLLGRTNDLHIYAQAELQEIIEINYKHSDTRLNYKIVYHPLKYDKSEIIYEDEKLFVSTIILNHRVPCCGFIFSEKENQRNIIKEKIEEYSIPVSEINNIKSGADYICEDGKIILNAALTLDSFPTRKYAYCSDTCYDESIIEQIKKVDLLYHEATFMQNMLARAKATFHSTAAQAGEIALKAEVKQLIIGHYSARYKELEPLLAEAKNIFSNTVLAVEGEKYFV
ncbi:MAG: ribonuclease Z [Bacteroidia bacterium]